MIRVDIPGGKILTLQYAAIDFNGTIATDGKIIKECKPLLKSLAKKLDIYILTLDTNGTVKKECKDLPVKVKILDKTNGSKSKANFVKELGANNVVSIGNGVNDGMMFAKSALSMVVMGDEGCSTKSLQNSDIVTKNIEDALNLLLKSNRLIATLRK